jgi:hypothetical protein
MYVCISIYAYRISVLEFEFRGFTEIYASLLRFLLAEETILKLKAENEEYEKLGSQRD